MEQNFDGCTDGNEQAQDLFGQDQWANGFTAALQDFDDAQPTQVLLQAHSWTDVGLIL